jgi:hypothetical protein
MYFDGLTVNQPLQKNLSVPSDRRQKGHCSFFKTLKKGYMGGKGGDQNVQNALKHLIFVSTSAPKRNFFFLSIL